MSLSRSLTTGASALQSQQKSFDVISNNIANTSTTGYKASSVNFTEQFNQIYSYGTSATSSSGGTNPTQYGLGVSVGSISQNMTQGVIETTDRALDLAIDGEGYFVYKYNGDQVYSRAGAITYDSAGNLVDSSTGAYLQGYSVQTDANGRSVKDADGNNVLNRTVGNMTISPDVISQPGQTQSISVAGNLNSAAETGAERQTSITIYDNQGGNHTLNLTFTKSATADEYSIAGEIDGNAVTLPSSTLTFNADGTLNSPLSLSVAATDLNTALGGNFFDATTPKNVNLTFASSNNLLSGLTQFAATDTATITNQDGYESGSLESLSVDAEGRVLGAFTNGQSEILGQVVVAKFANPSALVKEGNNFLTESVNSGLANIGTAGEIFPSTSIASNSLEQSNVDLTEEFTNMISTQRAFEAASRIITVSDTLLQEINNLKR